MSEKVRVETVPIDMLVIDSSFQPRHSISDETVNDYAAAVTAGDIFPAVDAFQFEQCLTLVDGAHRRLAYKKAGKDEIECRIHQGDRQAALMFCLTANMKHGLRDRPEDKRRKIELALADEVLGKKSTEALAKLLGMAWATVDYVRKRVQPVRDSEVTYERGDGKKITIDTAHIGAGKEKPAEETSQSGKSRKPEKKKPTKAEDGPTDSLGAVIPKHLRDSFADEWLKQTSRSLVNLISHARRVGQGNRFLSLATVVEYLQKAVQATEDAIPFAVHENCGGEGCELCRNHGWVPQWRWEELQNTKAA